MFLETTLLFKTMLILSAQLSVVLGGCFYCIRAAHKAYETDSTFSRNVLQRLNEHEEKARLNSLYKAALRVSQEDD